MGIKLGSRINFMELFGISREYSVQKIFRKLIILTVLSGVLVSIGLSPLQADSYHNINGFFGERATGLGGAFSAIADDPSGGFYNPAGLVYADGDSISISASNYNKISKTTVDALGPGQDQVQKSEGYLPNFIGALTDLKGESQTYKFGLSLVTPSVETFNQSTQIIAPFTLPDLAEARVDFTQQNSIVMGGPSLAIPLGDKLSIGATLYFFSDFSLQTNALTSFFYNGGFTVQTGQDERRTRGFLPILGLMYLPTDQISLGLSLRQTFVTAKKRRQSFTTITGVGQGNVIATSLATHNGSAVNATQGLFIGPPVTGEIPEIYEARGGIAWFPTSKFLTSVDLIYTSAYSKKQDNTSIAPLNSILLLGDEEITDLTRKATVNVAAGLEYYISENLSIKLGFFTNQSNNEDISWLDSYIQATVGQSLPFGAIFTPVGSGVIGYKIPYFQERTRNEYVNTQGYSLGFAYTDAESSISLTFITEQGDGSSSIPNQAISKYRYRSLQIYLAATTMRR